MDIGPALSLSASGLDSATADSAPPPSPLAHRIARQLRANLDKHRLSGDAYVVSVYGEWGIGKTFYLQSQRRIFEQDLADLLSGIAAGAAPDTLTVPVFFDPWRFEHEEHLAVPLLKTIEYRLREFGADIEVVERRARPIAARVAAGAGAIVANVGRAARTFADVAVALAAGFKFKLAPLSALTGIDAELSVKDSLEAARKASEADEARRAKAEQQQASPLGAGTTNLAIAAAKRESLYFETYQALRQLTEGDATRLRLVVLIDDLDRCLPEKAIQVLESIKLFLNVPGFSFVLAVDDEVVERGIAHRYRDYATANDGDRPAPISGAEYLEKIVHLPVHLQRWTRDEAATFLRKYYPSLFASTPRPSEAADPDARDAITAGKTRTVRAEKPRADTEAERVCDLVTGAVPLVPRKLIRLAEALAFMRDQFDEIRETRTWSVLHAARVVAIQQLYPRCTGICACAPAAIGACSPSGATSSAIWSTAPGHSPCCKPFSKTGARRNPTVPKRRPASSKTRCANNSICSSSSSNAPASAAPPIRCTYSDARMICPRHSGVSRSRFHPR